MRDKQASDFSIQVKFIYWEMRWSMKTEKDVLLDYIFLLHFKLETQTEVHEGAASRNPCWNKM